MIDAIELEVLWGSLVNTVNEQARALQRAAFSPIVREAGDLANALFDRDGNMVAQAITGTPGHINSLAMGARHVLAEHPPDSLDPGDVLITNDPYRTAGQLLDVTVMSPVWRNRRVIAFFGSTIHHTDVGGYGIGAGHATSSRKVCGSRSPSCSSEENATVSFGSSSWRTSANPSTWLATCTHKWPRARSARAGSKHFAMRTAWTTSRT